MYNEFKMKRVYVVAIVVALVLLVLFLMNVLFQNQLLLLKEAIYVVVLPASIALFISYLIAPMEKAIRKVVRVRTLSVILSIIILLLIVLGVTFLIVYLLVEQIIVVIDKVQLNWPFFEQLLKPLLPLWDYLKNSVTDGQELSLATIFIYLGKFGSMFSAMISIIMTVIMVPIFLFFILYDKSRIFNGICSVIPHKYQTHARELGKRVDDTLTKYFHAKIITILFLSVIFSLGFATVFVVNGNLSIPLAILYGIMFGLILAFFDLVPYVGPLIGAVLPMLFIGLLSTNINELILYPSLILAINFFGQWSQKMLIEPLVMSKEVDLHPLLVFTSMLFFGALFGFVGIILATPICGIIKAASLYIRQLRTPVSADNHDDSPNVEELNKFAKEEI